MPTERVGAVLAGAGLALLVGLAVLAVARRLARGEPLPRPGRVAAWRRASPWLAGACAACVLLGAVLAVVDG